MAVDYTKVFTVIGKYGDKINDYRAYIATYTSDQSAIETVLAAQSLVRLEDGLTDLFNDFKQDISDGSFDLLDRITTVLTDEQLIGANFSFGQAPTLDIVFPALIHDMAGNDKNVAANTATIGIATYDTDNDEPGVLISGATLDGVTPPMQGAQAIKDYAGLSTQLTPTSETLTFTCTNDSEHGAQIGSETFTITGVGADSDGFDVTGENAGQLGSIIVADSQASLWMSNPSFDIWTAGEPDGWTVEDGASGSDYDEGVVTVNSDASLWLLADGATVTMKQILTNDVFERNKAYFLSLWISKDADAATDPVVSLQVLDGAESPFLSLNLEPTTTSWVNVSGQFVVPPEIEGNLRITLDTGAGLSGCDGMYIDNLVIIPCEYFEGVAFAIVAGPDKFIQGDTATIALSNNDAGKFQTLFRKGYKIQLPTDATPTISDSLYA